MIQEDKVIQGDNKIAVGQLGCGYWGPNLLRNLAADEMCALVAVADPDEDRRRYVKETFPAVRVEADPSQIISDPTIQAVVIATPATSHESLVRDALRAGKHVLVEKPVATSFAAARGLMKEANATKLVLMVGHTFLFNAAVVQLKELIEGRELGDIYYLYGQRVNLGQVRSDVNAWWNLAPHDVSILLYLRHGLLPASVTATGMSSIQPGIEDVVFASLEWDDEVMAHLHVSWLDPAKIRRMTVVGSRKMAIYDDLASEKIEVWDKGIDRVPRAGERMDFDAPPGRDLRHRFGERFVPPIDFEEPLKVEVRHFLRCVLNGDEPLTGPKHAADVVAILEAVEIAMREKRQVHLSEVTG